MQNYIKQVTSQLKWEIKYLEEIGNQIRVI